MEDLEAIFIESKVQKLHFDAKELATNNVYEALSAAESLQWQLLVTWSCTIPLDL